MDFFGLDIGSHTLKIVQLSRRGGKYQLSSFASSPSNQKGLLSDSESDLSSLAQAIKKLHQEAKIKTKNVVTALPQDQVFTRVITLPPLSAQELESALKWEAEQYIPLPLEEVTLSFEIVGKTKEAGKEKNEVLLAAAPKTLIEKAIKVLKAAGLNPISLEMEMTALARSLVSQDEQTVFLVDFGAKATDLAIVEGGKIVLIHSVPTAGEALTRAISFQLGLEPTQAEAYKRAYGVDREKLEGKVSEAIEPVLKVIIGEIQKMINFYQEKGKTVQRLVLVGGTAGLPEAGTFLTKKLNLEVQIGNPFAQVLQDELLAKIPPEERSLYAVAVGLAMKEI